VVSSFLRLLKPPVAIASSAFRDEKVWADSLAVDLAGSVQDFPNAHVDYACNPDALSSGRTLCAYSAGSAALHASTGLVAGFMVFGVYS
jgi:hypothetical protein